MPSLTVLFLIASFVTAIASALGKCPLWVAVILLWIAVALQSWPR